MEPGQANSIGGAGKPAGAQAENTFQNKNVKQLVMLVRYKPKPPSAGFGDMSAAAGLIQGATGAVEGAVNAVETAMASIPGLEMFIKEKKTDSPSETDYTFDYSDWDKKLNLLEGNLQQINPENKTDTFEFSVLDAAGRKKEAQNLLTKAKDTISKWSGYTVWIHFVGLGQGANVINECTGLLSKDGQFNSENKWVVKTVIYVGASLYKDQHILDTGVFKGSARVVSFGNGFDLTQHALDYFEPLDKLLQMVKDSNKNTLSLAVGKIKLHVLKILTLVLGGLNLSTGNQDDLNKFGLIKSEVEGMIEDIVGLVKKISTDTAAFIKLGDLPDFGKIMDGYGDIPKQCITKLENFFDDFTKEAGRQAKKANVSLGPKDLAGALNCLCPLFDHITTSLSVFKYESKTGADLARQIIDSTGISTVFSPASTNDEDISQIDPYFKKAVNKVVKEGKPEGAFGYVANAQAMIAKATENGTDIKSYGDDQKIALAEAIYSLVRPMLVSKEQVYKELLSVADGFMNFKKLTENISANKLMSFPAEPLKNLQIDYPPDLKTSIEGTDKELTRIKGYFDKSNFDLQADSQYFIYNSRNVVFKTVPPAVRYCIDRETGFLDFQKSSGFDNEFPVTGNYQYNKAGSKQKENVMPAQEMPSSK